MKFAQNDHPTRLFGPTPLFAPENSSSIITYYISRLCSIYRKPRNLFDTTYLNIVCMLLDKALDKEKMYKSYNFRLQLRVSAIWVNLQLNLYEIYYFDPWVIIWRGTVCWFMVFPCFSQFLFVAIVKLLCTDMKIKTKTI